jgi:hypothetical protein
MATSPTGYQAYYQSPAQRDARQIGPTRPVIRWDADGDAMVVDEHAGRLVPATSLPDFRYLTEEESPVVGALPPQGWRLGFGQDDGTEIVEDLIGWAVHNTGVITPIVAGEWNQGTPMFHDTVDNELRLIPPGPVAEPQVGEVAAAAVAVRQAERERLDELLAWMEEENGPLSKEARARADAVWPRVGEP